MAEEKIPFTCYSCKRISKVPLNIKDKIGKGAILVCGYCGRVNEPYGTGKSDDAGHENEPFILCRFNGREVVLPLGPITIAGETKWTDANGKRNYTTLEWIKKFNIDPRVYWRNKILEDQAVHDAFILGHPAVATRR